MGKLSAKPLDFINFSYSTIAVFSAFVIAGCGKDSNDIDSALDPLAAPHLAFLQGTWTVKESNDILPLSKTLGFSLSRSPSQLTWEMKGFVPDPGWPESGSTFANCHYRGVTSNPSVGNSVGKDGTSIKGYVVAYSEHCERYELMDDPENDVTCSKAISRLNESSASKPCAPHGSNQQSLPFVGELVRLDDSTLTSEYSLPLMDTPIRMTFVRTR